MVKKLKIIFSLLVISTFCFAGCTNSSDYYVQGLVSLSQNQKEKAIKHFEKSIKSGSSVEIFTEFTGIKKVKHKSK